LSKQYAITLSVTVEVFPIFVITVDQPPPKGMSLGWSMNVVSESSSISDPNKLYPPSIVKSPWSQLEDAWVKLLSGAEVEELSTRYIFEEFSWVIPIGPWIPCGPCGPCGPVAHLSPLGPTGHFEPCLYLNCKIWLLN